MTTAMRSATLLGLSLVLLACAPATALADGTVTFTGGNFVFSDTSATSNEVQITALAGNVTISDSDSQPISESSDDCTTSWMTNSVSCTGTVTSAQVNLGPAGDTASLSGSTIGVGVTGGDGDDQVLGGEGTDAIFTGAGDDFADGLGGNGDLVDLGPGDDTGNLSGTDDDGTDDSIAAGAGVDVLTWTAGSKGGPQPGDALLVDLGRGLSNKTNPPAETNSTTGFEDFDGEGEAPFTVIGTAAQNVLDTEDGSDRVNPLGGSDRLTLRNGNDAADTRDGSSDRVDCGAGADSVAADQLDVLVDCETVTVTQVAPVGTTPVTPVTPRDATAPTCRLTRVKRTYGRTAFFRGFPARVACNERVAVAIQVLVVVRSSGRLITSRVGDLVLAERVLRLGAGARSTRLRPSRRLGRRLSGRFRPFLRIQARDAAGNSRLITRRVTVKAPPRKKRR